MQRNNLMCDFCFKDKILLLTGGASRLGKALAQEFLKQGLKGVTIADISVQKGPVVVKALTEEFGPDKAIFVETDVRNGKNFEEAFVQTIETFEHVDILINYANVIDDNNLENVIETNLNGAIYGTLLGLEKFILKYMTSDSGVIINISSLYSLYPYPFLPMTHSVGTGIVMASRSFGDEVHRERTNIKVVVICPGITENFLNKEIRKKFPSESYWHLFQNLMKKTKAQRTEGVIKGIISIVRSSESGSIWYSVNGETFVQFYFPEEAPEKLYFSETIE